MLKTQLTPERIRPGRHHASDGGLIVGLKGPDRIFSLLSHLPRCGASMNLTGWRKKRHFMGPRWGQRFRQADPTRLIVGRASSLTSANNSNASTSPPEKRRVAGSIPRLAIGARFMDKVTEYPCHCVGRFITVTYRIVLGATKLLSIVALSVRAEAEPTPWSIRLGQASCVRCRRGWTKPTLARGRACVTNRYTATQAWHDGR